MEEVVDERNLGGVANERHEEQAICAICAEGDWEDDNKIMFCDACDLCVHQVATGCLGVCVDLCLRSRLFSHRCAMELGLG